MDIASRIRQLEELIAEAKSVPLSSSVMVNREELVGLIEEIRQALPEEIKQARWVVRDREELLAKARRDAEAVLERARTEQARLISHQEVVRRATEEADRLFREAQEQAKQIKGEADDYVDAKLASFEVVLLRARDELSKTIQEIERGRDRLRAGSLVEEALAPEEESLER
ncbi:MAG: hypothetical protein ACRDH6_00695 [Actinomycetota bacterium]